MRDNVPASFQATARAVSARLKLHQERPKFEAVSVTGEVNDITESRAVLLQDGRVRRFCFRAGNYSQFFVGEYTPTATGSPAITYAAYSIPASPTINVPPGNTPPKNESDRSLSCAGNKLFIVNQGVVYEKTWDGQNGGFVQIRDFNYDVYGGPVLPDQSVFALNEDEIILANTYSGALVVDRTELYYLYRNPDPGAPSWNKWLSKDPSSKDIVWKGSLPRSSTRPRLTALKVGSVVHIYVDDHAAKKPVYVRFDRTNFSWSAAEPILPLDALDEDSSFSVSHVSSFRGKVFLTGILKRQYGPSFTIYMQGPDKFTFGRDLIISDSYQNLCQIMDLNTNYVWVDGPGRCYRAAITGPFGHTVTPTELDLLEFNADFGLNGPDRLNVRLPRSYYAAHKEKLIPGATLDLEVQSNGSSYQLGTFGVNAVRWEESEDSEAFSVDCSSGAVKKLMDWQSDTYFDYRAQEEVHGDPSDLTKIIRVSGQWGKENGLYLESLNESGFLYTTPSASEGGMMLAKFTNIPTDNAIVGVGLNYGEETLAQAAERLGVKVEEVTADQRARWGNFATFEPNGPLESGPSICLFSYNSARRGPRTHEYQPITGDYPNPWFEVVKYTLPAGQWTASNTQIFLRMFFQDGYVKIQYKFNDTDATWMDAINAHAQHFIEKHEVNDYHYGRGALFFHSDTGYYMSYPFASDSDVIPLYDKPDTVRNFGADIRNSVNKFTNSGYVLVDSELIGYSGRVYDTSKITGDLQWVPGKQILRSTADFANATGTEIKFAENRSNNYVVLEFDTNIPVGSFISGIRFWVKKNNFPEDGLEVTLWGGAGLKHGNTSTPLGDLGILASGSISADKISSSGGVVTCFFNNYFEVLSGMYFRIVIWRQKNHTHPDATNYYSFKLCPAAAGVETYVFAEAEPDTQTLQSGEMPFQLYGRVDPPGNEYSLTVQYEAGKNLPTAASTSYANPPNSYSTFYNGCAAVITEGAGKGNCWRIVRCKRYNDAMNDVFVFYLDRNAGNIFGGDTKVRATHALYGLSRGQVGPDGVTKTLAAAHGEKRKVNRYPAPALGKNIGGRSPYFAFFSSDEDLTVAEVGEQIARKAGVETVKIANAFTSPTLNAGQAVNFLARSQTCVMALKTTAGLASSFGLYFVGAGGSAFALVAGGGYVTAYVWTTANTWVPFDQVSFEDTGDYRVSLYEGHISLWCGGRLVLSTMIPVERTLNQSLSWTHVLIAAGSAPLSVLIPEAGTRVENFVMDMGKSGNQLLQSLIGEKRIFYRDNRFGELRIFTDRPVVPGVYQRATDIGTEHSDSGLATRLLLEGGEVVEVSNAGNLFNYGNLFKSANFREINNLEDAAYYAKITLEEMGLNLHRIQLSGAAEPTYEPGDKVAIQRRDGTQEYMVIDSVSHHMSVNETDAVYDMSVTGRQEA